MLLTTYEMLMGKLDRPRLSKLNWRYLQSIFKTEQIHALALPECDTDLDTMASAPSLALAL